MKGQHKTLHLYSLPEKKTTGIADTQWLPQVGMAVDYKGAQGNLGKQWTSYLDCVGDRLCLTKLKKTTLEKLRKKSLFSLTQKV